MKKTLASVAYASKIKLDCTCVDITMTQWEKLMENASKANGRRIRLMIKHQLPDLYEQLALDLYNPYEYQSKRTQTHLIYVYSGIEYFLQIL